MNRKTKKIRAKIERQTEKEIPHGKYRGRIIVHTHFVIYDKKEQAPKARKAVQKLLHKIFLPALAKKFKLVAIGATSAIVWNGKLIGIESQKRYEQIEAEMHQRVKKALKLSQEKGKK